MPWSGEGESWICWRYPFARPVAAVLVSLPWQLLASADLELLAFSDEADSFVPVPAEAAEYWPGDGPPPEGAESMLCLTVKVGPAGVLLSRTHTISTNCANTAACQRLLAWDAAQLSRAMTCANMQLGLTIRFASRATWLQRRSGSCAGNAPQKRPTAEPRLCCSMCTSIHKQASSMMLAICFCMRMLHGTLQKSDDSTSPWCDQSWLCLQLGWR